MRYIQIVRGRILIICGRFKHGCQCNTQEPCIHYWIIKQANGPISIGTCKICNTAKEFINWIHLVSNSTILSKKSEEDHAEADNM